MKNRPLALGIKIGIFWGSAVCLLTWLCYLTGQGTKMIEFFSLSNYPGYSISPEGSFIGLAWGFIFGLISGVIIGNLTGVLGKKD
jgi:hypothetical protein